MIIKLYDENNLFNIRGNIMSLIEKIAKLFENNTGKRIKEWKNKGLDVSSVLYVSNQSPDIAYTHNGCRVMLTQEELLAQEYAEGLGEIFLNVK